MKVKTISRNEEDYTRARSNDIMKLQRNFDPALHPHQKAREYTRALNATKLDRLFAKPFVGNLEGHRDGVYCMAKHPTELSCIASGSTDGEILVWNLTKQIKRWSINAHKGFVRGITMGPYGDHMYSCSSDKTVKKWKIGLDELKDVVCDYGEEQDRQRPMKTYLGKQGFTGIDHHAKQRLFATCGGQVDIWDVDRSEPLQTFPWGVDTVNTVTFNRAEVNVLASCASDRTIALFDLRTQTALRKVMLKRKSNSLCWNPQEPYHFTVANEDGNCYTFDMRHFDKALNIHKGHTSAALSIDYSPTGQEFVVGAYDKSMRIFRYNEGHSREIYTTKRMQKIFTVKWSPDARFVLSGSDETNIRIWKARANEVLATKSARERQALDYGDNLKERFKHHPKIRKMARQRQIPHHIKKAARKDEIQKKSEQRKDQNRRRHAKEGAIKNIPARKGFIVTEVE